jgi:hypothetical protein
MIGFVTTSVERSGYATTEMVKLHWQSVRCFRNDMSTSSKA